MPITKDKAFIPKPPRSTPFSSWRSSNKEATDTAARAAKGRTRRMTPDEGAWVMTDPVTATGTSSAVDPDGSAGVRNGKKSEPAF